MRSEGIKKKINAAALLGLMTVAVSAQSDKAHVLFYRPHNAMMGVALRPSIYFDRVKIGSLPNGRYFEVVITPGKYTLRADDNALYAENSVNLEGGRQYYVRVSLVGTKKGVILGGGGHLQLDVNPRDEALKAMEKLKPVDHPPYVLDSTSQIP